MISERTILALGVSAVLAACGGGGGGSNATSYPIQQALADLSANGLQQTQAVTGTASNGATIYPVTGSLTITESAATQTTFNGAPAIEVIETVSGNLTVNSQTVAFNSSETAYATTSHTPLATVATGRYCVPATPITYPTTATAGMTGNVGTWTCYSDSTEATPVGSIARSYVTTANANGNLNFEIITHIYNTSNTLLEAGSATYQISQAGALSLGGFTVTETSNGVTLSLSAGS
jgi:hypothetical protein